ncbi:hypothetical protein M0802_016836 [Mischocyttarus mexicanus]|nr:hypothetical protein M0802_016836 [Mischocyttarus mexicanus]
MYDYEAQDLDEVSFCDGDLIVNCTAIDEGWMTGLVQRTGRHAATAATAVAAVAIISTFLFSLLRDTTNPQDDDDDCFFEVSFSIFFYMSSMKWIKFSIKLRAFIASFHI